MPINAAEKQAVGVGGEGGEDIAAAPGFCRIVVQAHRRQYRIRGLRGQIRPVRGGLLLARASRCCDVAQRLELMNRS